MDVDRDALPSAVVFDCDGTLVDSERISEDATRDALAGLGHELTEADLAAIVGRPWAANQRYFVERWSLDDDALDEFDQRYRALARPRFADPTIVFGDVVEVLDALALAEVPVAVCTSSTRAHLDTILGLGPLRDRFLATVAAEDTEVHKPDPTPYLLSLRRLGAAVGRTLQPAAGVAAGCWTVGVDRGSGIHDLGAADAVVSRVSLEHLVPAR